MTSGEWPHPAVYRPMRGTKTSEGRWTVELGEKVWVEVLDDQGRRTDRYRRIDGRERQRTVSYEAMQKQAMR